jgi:hypothetical protein
LAKRKLQIKSGEDYMIEWMAKLMAEEIDRYIVNQVLQESARENFNKRIQQC